MKLLKCQYWVQEPYCVYWNVEKALCDFYTLTGVSEEDARPSFFPFCNFVGSATKCSFYEKKEDEVSYRCVRADPYRSIGNYETSTKWAFYTYNGTTYSLDTSLITGYADNGLDCNGSGSSGGENIECSAYAPYHIGFGKILPDSEPVKEDSRFKFRLPLTYDVLNVRAKLSTCYWWEGNVKDYILVSVDLDKAPYKVIKNVYGPTISGIDVPLVRLPEDTTDTFYFSKGCRRNDTSEYTIQTAKNVPCNGAHDKCPYYTGECWKYVKHDKVITGNFVSAEQILELRYYYHGAHWDKSLYENLFEETCIASWLGDLTYVVYGDSIKEATYKVAMTEIDFDAKDLTIKYDISKLEEGTEAAHDGNVDDSEGDARNFPSLVKEVKELLLSPVVLNEFELFNGQPVFESNKPYNALVSLFGTQHTYYYDTLCVNISKLEEIPVIIKTLKEYKDVNALYAHTFDIVGETQNWYAETKFESIQKDVTALVDYLRIYNKEVLTENLLPVQDKAFIFDVEAPYGANTFLILTRYSNKKLNLYYWGYTFIDIELLYVGGFLRQTKYVVDKGDADEGIASTLYDYRRVLNAGTVEITFDAFASASLGVKSRLGTDFFNDYKADDILEADKTYVGYVKYNYVNTVSLDKTYLYTIGPGGHVLVTLPDLEYEDGGTFYVTHIYGTIKIQEDTDDDLYLRKDTNICPVTVVKFGLKDGLKPNQFIIKPKYIDRFFSVCDNTYLYIKDIRIPIKVSFDVVPKQVIGWELRKDDEGDLPAVKGRITCSGNKITITDIAHTVILTVPLKGVTERYINVVKLKVAIWVKQPLVPDVEMYYRWSAEQALYKNDPACLCCGKYTRHLINVHTSSYTPDCGDHEVAPTTGKGKMWYPYVQCQSYSRYNYISNQLYGACDDVKGLYKEVDGDGNRINGPWNMRMEGPTVNFYKTGLYCCSVCACNCPVETYNIVKQGDSYFSGFARYRGDVDEDTLRYWNATGGGLPKFGNVLRPQLLSFRSTDYVQYLYYDYSLDTPKYLSHWAWMPSTMFFSDISYTMPKDIVYNYFMSDYTVLPIDALGTMLFYSLDNETYNEYVSERRLRYEEVFEVYLSTEKIAYPSALISDGFRVPVPQFKKTTEGYIQWAWREIHEPIKRDFDKSGNILLFTEFYYPDYIFDRYNIEHRTVCEEGEHTVKVVFPKLIEKEGVYENKYPYLQLDNGLPRCFNWEGVFVSECPVDGYEGNYQDLTSPPWLDMGLFDSNYVTTTEEANNVGTVISRLDSLGEEYLTYYNRGLLLGALSLENTSKLPIEYEALSNNDIIYTPTDLDVSMFGQSLTFKAEFSPKKRAITKGSFTFRYGIEKVEEGNNIVYNIYCVPKIVYGSYFSTDLKVPTFLDIRNEVVEFDYAVDIDYFINRSFTFECIFDCSPPINSNGELIKPAALQNAVEPGDLFIYKVALLTNDVLLYDTILKDITEVLYVYERKYRVSVTNNNITPPHAPEENNRVLKPRFDSKELDTVWQRDKEGEVEGIANSSGEQVYVHKVRSRFVWDAYQDTQPIEGTVHYMERQQNKLYEQTLKKEPITLTYRSTYYPGMDYFFKAHGLVYNKSDSNGIMSNSIVYKLGTVRAYPKMEAQGYLLLPSLPWHELCSIGGRLGCNGDDTFTYNKYNMDDGTVESSSYTALNIFYGGTKLMVQRLKILKFLVTRVYTEYEVSAKGKVFEEGDSTTDFLCPEYFPMPGLYGTSDWYYPRRSSTSWPTILPGLWPRLGNIGDYV